MENYKLEEKSLNNLFRSIKSEMFGIMDVRGMNATGKTKSMIEYEVRGNKGVMKAPDHIEFLERGRGPGGFPPLEPIQDWCIAKGVPVEAAYPIAMKIAKEGTKLFKSQQKSGILSNVLTSQRLDVFLKEYLEHKGTEILGKYSDMLRG